MYPGLPLFKDFLLSHSIPRRLRTTLLLTSSFTLLGFFGHSHVITLSVNLNIGLGEYQ